MSICVEFVGGSLVPNSEPVIDCTSYILMTPNDFNANAITEFDATAFDTGFEAIVTMFITGIGIGAILAIINKLRR